MIKRLWFGASLWLVMPVVLASAMSESAVLVNYDGIIGNAPLGSTITSAGIGVQDNQNSAQSYLFFSQTFANHLYYEARVWGAYNFTSQNPIFPGVPVSNIDNPPGYGVSGFVGYNLHPSEDVEITPYLRLNYLKDMTIVYRDSNGNYISSQALSAFIGSKFSFKVTSKFTPFFNFWLGVQQINLSGDLQQGAIVNQYRTAEVHQVQANSQIGFSFKITPAMSISPYWQYMTAFNNPDNLAARATMDGGFAISSLTSTQQSVGVRYSYAW